METDDYDMRPIYISWRRLPDGREIDGLAGVMDPDPIIGIDALTGEDIRESDVESEWPHTASLYAPS